MLHVEVGARSWPQSGKRLGLALGALCMPVDLIERFLDMVLPKLCEWTSSRLQLADGVSYLFLVPISSLAPIMEVSHISTLGVTGKKMTSFSSHFLIATVQALTYCYLVPLREVTAARYISLGEVFPGDLEWAHWVFLILPPPL